MTDMKSSDSRRKLLKSIAVGSGAIIAGKNLPETWKRPVVDSIMLPAHAQTSGCSGCFSISTDQSLVYTPGTYPEGTIQYYRGADCTGEPSSPPIPVVEAANADEALIAYNAAYPVCTSGMVPVPAITCANVWGCD